MRRAVTVLFVYLSGLLVCVTVIFVFLYIFVKGAQAISWKFISTGPEGIPPGTAGGIFPAIVGSLMSGAVAAVISSITAVATTVWLTFFCRNRGLYRFCRFCTECVSGIPSILLGLFGYSFFLMHLAIPKSVLTAGMTLAIMIMPFIAVRTEKIFREYPREQIDAARSLGLSTLYIILTLVIPQRLRELTSTVALSTAYAMGAAAPVMFTGAVLYTRKLPDFTEPFMALPYHLYILVSQGYSLSMAYGTAFILLVLLLGINLFCRYAGKKR